MAESPPRTHSEQWPTSTIEVVDIVAGVAHTILVVQAGVGTRVVLLLGGSLHDVYPAGVVIEERLERYLKRFVVRCDNGSIRYASGSELALESDSSRTPLGPRAGVS
jgi:hypothetical protein